jgi:hypothetical protein
MMTPPGSMTEYCEQHRMMWRQSKIMGVAAPAFFAVAAPWPT